MASSSNTDFLKFNAYDIKDVITRRLSQDSKYTDQIYEGSNLAILIDLISYMYQCLVYNINNAASESMFSDTQQYKNINRLVSMIGYNPRGMEPSQLQVAFDNRRIDSETGDYSDEGGRFDDCLIKAYSFIDTQLTDKNGNEIYFSTGREPIRVNNEVDFEFTMYNGKWKLLDTVYIATGSDFETFTLDIGSDSENNVFVSNQFIDVFVMKNDYRDGEFLEHYTPIDTNLFKSTTVETADVYSKNDKHFNIRLNEDKKYQIKFGNGVNCAKLEEGDQLYIFYLESNSTDTSIELGQISNATLIHSASDLQISQSLYDIIDIFTDSSQDTQNSVYPADNTDGDGAVIKNVTITTTPSEEESVDEIRENAPNWFKTGGRLVTRKDYEYYMKSSHRGDIVDVVCMNNDEYLASFYAWLYNIGKTKHGDPRYYLNQSKITKYDYVLADGTDFKNVYLWIKRESIADIPTSWLKELDNIKCITDEPISLSPVDVNFQICAADSDVIQAYMNDPDSNVDPFTNSYIEITMDSNALFVSTSIQSKVQKIIRDFFKPRNHVIGETISYNDMIQDIMSINGVERIRTVFNPYDNTYDPTIRNGLCFATWSGSMIDDGDDLDVSTTSRSLEKFQFPVIYNSDLVNVKIIKRSITSINQVQY